MGRVPNSLSARQSISERPKASKTRVEESSDYRRGAGRVFGTVVPHDTAARIFYGRTVKLRRCFSDRADKPVPTSNRVVGSGTGCGGKGGGV
jgi:hypothetical protein